MRAIAIGLVLTSVLLLPQRVEAQSEHSLDPAAATFTLTAPERLGASDADRLATLRRSHRDARTTEGFVLLGYAIASIAVGAFAAGIGNQDDRWLGFGLGTMGWGAINALFSIFLFDLGDARLHRIESDRSLRGDGLDRAREDWAADQYSTGALIAANAGLDIFYVATGIFLYVIAGQMTPELRSLEGYGIAMAAQGLGLLAYDLTTWIAATQRGDEARMLFRDDDAEVAP